jgi:pyruvate dehydrogenase E2 component (dihydrolipoamide acetyltransferase)
MATPVIMPRQGQSVESCIIGKWYKQVGDKVAVGEDLFSYETDKATFDETAKVEGELLAIFFPAEDDVPCLMNVCVIGKAGESVAEFDPRGAGAEAAPRAAPARSARNPVDRRSTPAASARPRPARTPPPLDSRSCWAPRPRSAPTPPHPGACCLGVRVQARRRRRLPGSGPPSSRR